MSQLSLLHSKVVFFRIYINFQCVLNVTHIELKNSCIPNNVEFWTKKNQVDGQCLL